MIIKRKYLEKKQTPKETSPSPETVEKGVVQDAFSEEENNNIEQEDKLDENSDSDNTKSEESNEDDLDISMDDIKFEQREERREGTRRRGYRRTQDRNLLTRAQQEAISIKEAAKQEGYNEGIALAQDSLQDIRKNFEEFYNYKDAVVEKVSECIYDISVEIAKKIIKKEVEADKESVILIIKELVNDINKTENKITLKVMPKDVELVKDKVPQIFIENNIEAKIIVMADNDIQEGGVIVETSNGVINASIDTQLSIIEKTLKAQKES